MDNEIKKTQIPFWIRFKALAFGKTVYGSMIIRTSFIVSFMWHIINLIFIMFGWILIASYIDDFFNLNWIVDLILSFILILFLNFIGIVYSPIKIEHEK